MTGLVVDTSVLHKANDATTPEHWDAASLLTKLPGQASVYVDAENGIVEEYFRSVFRVGIQSLAFLWWQRQQSINGVVTVAGRLTSKEEETFARGCDPSDRPFVGVALRASVPVVHEDGDYEEPCAAALGVVGFRLASACAALGL